MKIYNSTNIKLHNKTAVALGNFDGFHTGHIKLINAVKASGYETVVFTLFPHPAAFFKGTGFKALFDEGEKAELAEALGVDNYIRYPFTKEFSRLCPLEFVRLLKEKTNCAFLAVGENYTFGKNKSGTAKMLEELGQGMGIYVKIVDEVCFEGKAVSSTRIRELLKTGDIKKANLLLGRDYFIGGTVEEGRQRGRKMGFPTANINIGEEKLLPLDGVYATQTVFDGIKLPSVTNVGKNPTFNNSVRTVETFLPDFKGNLYGKRIKVAFKERIRGEIRFFSKEELAEQIKRDIAFIGNNAELRKH